MKKPYQFNSEAYVKRHFPSDFKVGDLVRLKSGGPTQMVVDVDEKKIHTATEDGEFCYETRKILEHAPEQTICPRHGAFPSQRNRCPKCEWEGD